MPESPLPTDYEFKGNSELRAAMAEFLDSEKQDAAIAVYGPIQSWDVSGVQDFSSLFEDESNGAMPGADEFNQDVSGWDVSGGTKFDRMFYRASAFNRDISEWNVSSGTSFTSMFRFASAFNQDIAGWNVSSGRYFLYMFHGASSFNQDLCSWGQYHSPLLDYTDIFKSSGCPDENSPTRGTHGHWCRFCLTVSLTAWLFVLYWDVISP